MPIPKANSAFNSYSKSEKLKARKKAYKIWVKDPTNRKPRRLNDIAKEVGMTKEQLSYYMKKDKWIERYNKGAEKADQIGSIEAIHGLENKDNMNKIEQILEDSKLPERQKLFILYYLQNYNGALAAIQAGYPPKKYSAYQAILSSKKVRETLRQIKSIVHQEIFITGHDILNEYIKIAFADITQFIDVKDNRLMLKDSNQIDGTLIQEIKEGRDGVTIKLHDKMKALEKLEKLFDLIPDKKLELDNKKFELQKQLVEQGNTGSGKSVTIIDDI